MSWIGLASDLTLNDVVGTTHTAHEEAQKKAALAQQAAAARAAIPAPVLATSVAAQPLTPQTIAPARHSPRKAVAVGCVAVFGVAVAAIGLFSPTRVPSAAIASPVSGPPAATNPPASPRASTRATSVAHLSPSERARQLHSQEPTRAHAEPAHRQAHEPATGIPKRLPHEPDTHENSTSHATVSPDSRTRPMGSPESRSEGPDNTPGVSLDQFRTLSGRT